ncbi:hypothetical protein OAB00_02170 [Akkermansiaceae bacterium]|nr:hypothetical protein [Akkermansiaceae bacterium]
MTENPYITPAADPSPVHHHSSNAPVIPSLEQVQYPLLFTFKIVAFAPQLSVTDATGREILYVKQKLFKFKEAVEVFSDKSKSNLLGTIKANKVIDWSARYFFHTASQESIGSVGRKGMKSLWKASYEVFSHGAESPEYKITEENPMAKVFDSLLGEIPIIGFGTAYLFNPKYGAVNHANNMTSMRLSKQPAFFEGKFKLEKLQEMPKDEEVSLIFSFLMLVLLERARG